MKKALKSFLLLASQREFLITEKSERENAVFESTQCVKIPFKVFYAFVPRQHEASKRKSLWCHCFMAHDVILLQVHVYNTLHSCRFSF